MGRTSAAILLSKNPNDPALISAAKKAEEAKATALKAVTDAETAMTTAAETVITTKKAHDTAITNTKMATEKAEK